MNAGVVYGYFALYQRVEDEEFGGAWELLKEGFVTSFALFLVSHLLSPKGQYVCLSWEGLGMVLCVASHQVVFLPLLQVNWIITYTAIHHN